MVENDIRFYSLNFVYSNKYYTVHAINEKSLQLAKVEKIERLDIERINNNRNKSLKRKKYNGIYYNRKSL